MAVDRNPDGTVKKGAVLNPTGRPRESRIIFTETDVRKALQVAKEEHGGVDLLTHLCSKAYSDTKVAVAILKKILPDLTRLEVIDPLRAGVWECLSPADAAAKMDELTVNPAQGEPCEPNPAEADNNITPG